MMMLEQRYRPHFTGGKTDAQRSDLPRTLLLVSGDAEM